MRFYRYINEEKVSKRAMIDLDGTLHKYSKGYMDGSIYDEPFEGAKEFIDWLKSQGYEIVIFTTRASKENAKEFNDDLNKQLSNTKKWLDKNNIKYDRITGEKLAADFYIDDKAINAKNGDYEEIKKQIQGMK
jgi:hypothetical protein